MFNQNSANILEIMLDDIRRDGGTQPRVAIDWKHVKVLKEQMLGGEKLEPVIVFERTPPKHSYGWGFIRYVVRRLRNVPRVTGVLSVPLELWPTYTLE